MPLGGTAARFWSAQCTELSRAGCIVVARRRVGHLKARASVAVALEVGGGGGRRGRWAACAHQCRECPAEVAPYAGTLPSSLAMACGVVAGGSGSLPSLTSVSQGRPAWSRRSTSTGRELGPCAVWQQFLRPRGVGPARAALKLAVQPKNPRCGERHGPQATWPFFVELS